MRGPARSSTRSDPPLSPVGGRTETQHTRPLRRTHEGAKLGGCEPCRSRAPHAGGSAWMTPRRSRRATPSSARRRVSRPTCPAARRVAAAVNATRRAGEPSAQAGELAALELLHEIFHLLVERAGELRAGGRDVVRDRRRGGPGRRAEAGPPAGGGRGRVPGRRRQAGAGPPRGAAARPDREREPGGPPAPGPDRRFAAAIRGSATPRWPRWRAYHAALPPIGPNGETLVELLRAPARAHPTSLAGQLRYVREHWASILGAALEALLDRLLLTIDVIAEEERGLHLRFGGGGRRRRPRGGAGPHRTGRRARALLQRFGLDAAGSSSSRRAPTSGSTSCRGGTAARSARWTRSRTRSWTGSPAGGSPASG